LAYGGTSGVADLRLSAKKRVLLRRFPRTHTLYINVNGARYTNVLTQDICKSVRPDDAC
jgi:hypothetical protein